MTYNSKEAKPSFWRKGQLNRQWFLKVMGGSAMIAFGASACDDDDNNGNVDEGNGINLGSGDKGIMNFAYALEQLEFSFYDQVINNAAFTTIFPTNEQNFLKEIHDNELVHREFFRTALGGDAIQDLETDFSSIDFTNRVSVLTSAYTFEDTGISAYNGSGQFLSDTNILGVAGKIVSVEARHSAILRNLLAPKTIAFAGDDAVNPMGLDLSKTPREVLPLVQPYFKETLNANNLPNA
jgi:Ferritin-like domain